MVVLNLFIYLYYKSLCGSRQTSMVLHVPYICRLPINKHVYGERAPSSVGDLSLHPLSVVLILALAIL
jgi:hypothetical protein